MDAWTDFDDFPDFPSGAYVRCKSGKRALSVHLSTDSFPSDALDGQDGFPQHVWELVQWSVFGLVPGSGPLIRPASSPSRLVPIVKAHPCVPFNICPLMRHCELWLKSYRAHAWLGACLGSWHGEPARLVPILSLSPDRGRAYLRRAAPRRWSLVVMGHRASPVAEKGVPGYALLGNFVRG